jgi:hypothetical protein
MTANVSTIQIRLYPDGRMCAKDASDYVGLSEKTMAMMRCKGTGPRFVKRGRIFYFKSDLDDWLQKGIAQTTAQCTKR